MISIHLKHTVNGALKCLSGLILSGSSSLRSQTNLSPDLGLDNTVSDLFQRVSGNGSSSKRPKIDRELHTGHRGSWHLQWHLYGEPVLLAPDKGIFSECEKNLNKKKQTKVYVFSWNFREKNAVCHLSVKCFSPWSLPRLRSAGCESQSPCSRSLYICMNLHSCQGITAKWAPSEYQTFRELYFNID